MTTGLPAGENTSIQSDNLLLLALLSILLATSMSLAKLLLVVLLLTRGCDEISLDYPEETKAGPAHIIVKVLIVKLVVVELLHVVIVLKGLAGKVVNGSWDDLTDGKQ